MSKIPDDALRAVDDSVASDDTLTVRSRDGLHVISMKALLRDLLACREALRAASAELADAASFCCGRANHEDDMGWDDWMDMSDRYKEAGLAARACLPESAKEVRDA